MSTPRCVAIHSSALPLVAPGARTIIAHSPESASRCTGKATGETRSVAWARAATSASISSFVPTAMTPAMSDSASQCGGEVTSSTWLMRCVQPLRYAVNGTPRASWKIWSRPSTKTAGLPPASAAWRSRPASPPSARETRWRSSRTATIALPSRQPIGPSSPRLRATSRVPEYMRPVTIVIATPRRCSSAIARRSTSWMAPFRSSKVPSRSVANSLKRGDARRGVVMGDRGRQGTPGSRTATSRPMASCYPAGARLAGDTGRASSLDDGDLSGHARPVVVGARQGIAADLTRDEVEVLLLAGLDHELGPLRVQHRGVSELHALEEGGRRELVKLLAAVLELEPVRDVDSKRQIVRLEAIVGRDDGDDFR